MVADNYDTYVRIGKLQQFQMKNRTLILSKVNNINLRHVIGYLT